MARSPVRPAVLPLLLVAALLVPPRGAWAGAPEAAALRSWRLGGALRASGALTSLTGGGLGLAGTLTEWLGAPEAGRGLLYAATGAIGAGFTLSAVGLGLQHRGLADLGVNPGWRLYGSSTALGGTGLLAAAAAHLLRQTDYAPADQRDTLALSFALVGATCLITASILYFVDGRLLRGAFQRWQARGAPIP